ncbi:tetratricopeptide repeat protein [Leucobacter sp. HNU]|uniref:tetratricopeptide repeat protein n=1 Tax=Leucobacter sp. HNU TaxID=3236805 RepID=UPI003A7FB9EE
MGERGWLRGLALISLGRADEAEPLFRELTAAVDRTDDGMGLASIGWFGVAEIERARGRFADAIASFGRAIAEFRDSDQRASPGI